MFRTSFNRARVIHTQVDKWYHIRYDLQMDLKAIRQLKMNMDFYCAESRHRKCRHRLHLQLAIIGPLEWVKRPIARMNTIPIQQLNGKILNSIWFKNKKKMV